MIRFTFAEQDYAFYPMKTFEETQKISSPALRVFLFLVIFSSITTPVLVFFTDILGHFEDDDSIGILITAITFLMISLLFLLSRLETKIDKEGIYVRYLPILLKWRFYPWSDIEKAHIREYSPLMEYGGWGFRIGIMGQGNAYMISGKVGLQLEFKNGKKLLIGTKKRSELKEFIDKHNSQKIES